MDLSPREHFLLEFYNNVWLNVRRAETSLWILFPIFFTAITGLLLSIDRIGIFLVLLLLLFLCIFFSMITFNFNSWFVRNMRLISKAEREFLIDSDYNKIIPKRWSDLKIPFINKQSYCLAAVTYILIGITLTFYLTLNNNLLKDQIIVLLIFWEFSLIFEFWYVNVLKKSYDNILNETK